MEQLVEFAGNHLILVGVWVALAVMLVMNLVGSTLSKVKEVTTHEATLMVNKQDAAVVDIRPATDFRKGHILGAVNLKQEAVKENDFTTLEKFKSKPIIVVCAMGMSAKAVATNMRKAGFNASVLKGGMNQWTSVNLPVAK